MKPETNDKILDATRDLLAEYGVQGLTVEGVATRAGVAKTTIYRRYRSKHDLALAVLLRMVQEVVAVPDLGDTRAELVSFVNGAVHILGDTLMGRVMQGLVSDLATGGPLTGDFRERIVATRLAEVRRVVDRGIERGELRPEVDYELVHDLLFGPVYYRLLLSGGPLSDDLAQQIVDAVLPSLTAGPAAAAPSSSQDRRAQQDREDLLRAVERGLAEHDLQNDPGRADS
jgi:AcrR family transcriptional regulator